MTEPAESNVTFAKIIAGAPTRSYKAGDTIFRTGEPGLEAFLVKSGQVEIRADDRVLETVGPEGLFGEMALIDGWARSASAIAATDVELAVLSERQFLSFIALKPHFAFGIMRVLAQRLRRTTQGT
jgi:CRP-like cAMP-binding protein